MRSTKSNVAALAIILASGFAVVVAASNSTDETSTREPSEVKSLSAGTFGEMLDDLRKGKEIRVDARETIGSGVPSRVNDGQEVVNHLRGYGPLPAYAKARLLSVYQEAIDGLRVRVQTPQGGGRLQDILAEATDLALLEEFLAKQSVVQDGAAFFAEYKLIPSWDGWRVLAEQNQTLIVDQDGIPIENPASYPGPRESVVFRKMAVIVPIELARFPVLQASLEYKRDMEVEVTRDRVDRFNAMSYDTRQSKLQQHISARRAISALGGSGSGRHAEIENLKKLLLDVPYVDSVTLLARMNR